jgi:hypothetical protein
MNTYILTYLHIKNIYIKAAEQCSCLLDEYELASSFAECTHTHYIHVCMYVCICICICIFICMYVYIYICMCICIFVCMYMYVCMYVCMYICIYINMRIWLLETNSTLVRSCSKSTHTHTHKYSYIHTHTHTYARAYSDGVLYLHTYVHVMLARAYIHAYSGKLRALSHAKVLHMYSRTYIHTVGNYSRHFDAKD